jgi:hypothetical protein
MHSVHSPLAHFYEIFLPTPHCDNSAMGTELSVLWVEKFSVENVGQGV